MRRALAFVVADWPLKVAAIVVAALLYSGFVLSESAQVWRGSLAVVALRQPTNAVLVGSLPEVTSIRYFAPGEVADRLSSASFSATIDLAGIEANALDPFVTVRVVVTAADPRVRILDFEPQTIRVQLDPLATRTVPVIVERGPLPEDLTVGEPTVVPATVTVSGPESLVRLVAAAEARVLIQSSGLDVDQEVDLVAIDASGNAVSPVDLEPASARVRIRVGSSLLTRTLPVAATLAGSPAAGWEVASVSVEPAIVLVEGEAAALATPARIETAPVSISGASADVTATVELALPSGVEVVGPSTVRVVVRLREILGTRTLDLGIVARGAQPGLVYSLTAGRATVTFGGPIRLLDALDAGSLVVTVDVSDLNDGTATLPLRIVVPSGVTVVAIQPSSVGVTVAPAVPTTAPTATETP